MEGKQQHSDTRHNRKLLYFFISLLAAAGLTWFAHEPSFTQSQTYVLFILIFSIGLWLTEAVPPFSVGLLIIAFLVYSLGYERFNAAPENVRIYTETFSSSVIWLMLGGFFLAAAMTKTKLDIDLIQFTLRICGNKPRWILAGTMSLTMIASMLISNTATTAMVVAALMPLLLKLGKNSPVGKGLILGIPIAATTGGMGTMIGSPPNAIAVEALATHGNPINFTMWIYYGLPLTLVLTFIAWRVLVRKYMREAQPLQLAKTESEKKESLATSSSQQRWIVIFILIGTLVLWLTSPVHDLSAAAVSAVPLVFLPVTGILNGHDIRAMGWDTLILVAGGLSLGTALQQTGLLHLYADRIARLEVPAIAFYFMLAYTTMFFSNIMSNTATSTVLIPLAMAVMPQHSLEVAMVIGLSASTSLFLPVSTPPNAIAYSTGFIEQKDLRTGGVLIGILGPALVVLWVLLIS